VSPDFVVAVKVALTSTSILNEAKEDDPTQYLWAGHLRLTEADLVTVSEVMSSRVCSARAISLSWSHDYEKRNSTYRRLLNRPIELRVDLGLANQRDPGLGLN
jgi:hypothetical protein